MHTTKPSFGKTGWFVNVTLDNKTINCQIDTGADVSVLPLPMINKLNVSMCKTDCVFVVANGVQVQVVGKVMCTVNYGKCVKSEFFVFKTVSCPLLGLPERVVLDILDKQCINTVKQLSIQNQYPQLFQPLGKLKDKYKIELTDDAIPFVLTAATKVPIPLLPRVKAELDQMQRLVVISLVTQHTDWCNALVGVPKKIGCMRLCVGYGPLNK